MSDFKDLFSAQSLDYAQYRPHYPSALFSYLASICPSRRAVWDCGTGNGQAAVASAEHFSRVYATDPSEKQMALAEKHPKVEYRVAKAERSGLEDYSVNLITVAQAFHWFEQEDFYREVRRVSEPGGVLAIWCYELCAVDEDVDAVTMRLYRDILGGFWDERRRLVEEGYRNEKVPFNELTSPPFEMQARWSLAEYAGYLSTWSALQKYKEKHGGQNPLDLVADELRQAWGDSGQKKLVGWPLSIRVFQVS